MEANREETDRAVQAIETGLVNIADIHRAIQNVIVASDAALVWSLDPTKIPVLADAGLTDPVSPDDLTIGEQIAIADECGTGWDRFQPDHHQTHAKALIKTLLAHRTDHQDPDAAANTVTTGQWSAAHSIVEQRPADPT